LIFTNPSRQNEDEMDIDDNGEEEEEDASLAPGSGDENENNHSQSTPKQKNKSNKGRKSELDMAALTSEQAALAALESNQLLSLKLRKKYYSEALNFIRQIEDAIPIAAQLLGSTSKSEVLESMEFFRVVHEYHFDGAEVSSVYHPRR
jgi:condensin complex subunit 1